MLRIKQKRLLYGGLCSFIRLLTLSRAKIDDEHRRDHHDEDQRGERAQRGRRAVRAVLDRVINVGAYSVEGARLCKRRHDIVVKRKGDGEHKARNDAREYLRYHHFKQSRGGACAEVERRLVEGVISGESLVEESFSDGLLEYPQYTRPEEYCGMKVPEVLLSGHHENIRKWRLYKRLEKTFRVRPDLIIKLRESGGLSEEAEKIIREFENGSD